MATHFMIDCLGWIATAVVVASYFCSKPQAMRIVQIAGALIWMSYGLLIGAYPVVVANVLVVGAASWTLSRPVRSSVDVRDPHQLPPGRGNNAVPVGSK